MEKNTLNYSWGINNKWQVGAIGMIFIFFSIALDGSEESSLCSVSKVQINITNVIAGGEKCFA